MFTQSAPALLNALVGALPDTAARALTQAVGNCVQPLTHRGAVNLQATAPRQDGPGSYSGDTWNPSEYAHLLPSTSDSFDADLAGWGAPGGMNSTNYGGNAFSFPTSQEFELNNYYGGPTLYSAGNSYFQNTYNTNTNTTNLNTTNLTVQNINGFPVAGPSGPQGQRGAAGRNGQDGQNGIIVLAGGVLPVRQARVVDRVDPQSVRVPIVTKVTFDSNTCTIAVKKKRIRLLNGIRARDRGLVFYGP